VVSIRRSSSAIWGRSSAVVERNIAMKIDRTSKADCMTFSVAGSNSDGHFFLWKHLKEHVYPVPKISWQHFNQMWQRSMPTCQGVFEVMLCGAMPSALKWMKAASNTYCNYETPMYWPFDSLRHLAVTCILKTIRHRAYVVPYFLPKKRSHAMESLFANFVSPYMYNA
jgi:hypothetical protein